MSDVYFNSKRIEYMKKKRERYMFFFLLTVNLHIKKNPIILIKKIYVLFIVHR